MSKQEIMEDFEEINEEMINACLAFAADKKINLRSRLETELFNEKMFFQ